jgi:predicted heme/steroid binding protein
MVMKHIIRTFLVSVFLAGMTLAQDITPIFAWKADISKETTYTLNLRRRNTAYFRPTIYNNGALQAIPTNATVTFRYQGVGLTNYYTVAGTVHSPTGGVLSVTWTPLCEATNANYEWEYMVKDGDVEVVRLMGTLNLTPSIASGTVTNPAFYRLDAVTNRGVVINGSYVTNGAVITVEAGIGTNVASMMWDNPPTVGFAEADPVFATNGVKRSDTNGWVVTAHNFPTFAQATQIVVDVTSTSVFANAISGATATQIVASIMATGTAYSATTAVPTNRTITFNSQTYTLDSNIVVSVSTNGQTALDVTNIVNAMAPSMSVMYAGTSYYATASATSADSTAHAALTTTAHGNIVPQSRTLNLNGTVYDLSSDRSWTITDSGARTQASNVQANVTAVSNQVVAHAALTNTAHGGIVPPTRTLNINGTVYDLSQNRSWPGHSETSTWQQAINRGNTATGIGNFSSTGKVCIGSGLSLADIAGSSYGSIQAGFNGGSVSMESEVIGSLQLVDSFGTFIISNYNGGVIQSGYSVAGGVGAVGPLCNGAQQSGWIGEYGRMTMDTTCRGAMQRGSAAGSILMGGGSYAALQSGSVETSGVMQMIDWCDGAYQFGYVEGRMVVANASAYQVGYVGASATATNAGGGALQLLYLTNNQHAVTTAGGLSSLLLGAGTASNKNAIVAGDGQVSHGDGSVTAGGGFWGSGAGIPDLVPTNRTLTINGTTKAFDANVSFTVDATNAVSSETVSNIVNAMATTLSVNYANTAGTSVYATAAGTATDATKVPTNRLLTINGTTYPMDADMTFTVAGTGWVSAVECTNIVSAMASTLSVQYAATAGASTDLTARVDATNALAIARSGTNLATTANVNATNALAVAISGTNLATIAQADVDAHELLTTTAHGGIVPSSRTITINGSGSSLAGDLVFTVIDATARTQGSNAQSTANSATNLITVHAALTTNAHGGVVALTDPRLTDARVDPTARTAASNAQAMAETATNLATLAQATASAAVPTNDANYLAAITGAVYVASSTLTVANRVLSIGTNGTQNIVFAGSGGRTTVRNRIITHEFLDTTSTGIVFTVTNAMTMDIMLVAGGGGGSSGGGGGGGVIVTNISVTNGTYRIYVGRGGRGAYSTSATKGFNGTNTSAFGLTAIGGGGGGAKSGAGTINGASGGSGGGGGNSSGTSSSGGSGTTGQGNAGGGNGGVGSPYPAGGGGGAVAAGSSPSSSTRAGDGGSGYVNQYTGETYGSGGGGGIAIFTSVQYGGEGGMNAGDGGNGASRGSDAKNGFGGGGGGAGNETGSFSVSGGNGGSGCVVVSYSW